MALEKFGALWKGKPNSKAVLSGKLEDGRRILIFKNEDKKTEKHPDYRLVVDTGDAAPIKPQDEPPKQRTAGPIPDDFQVNDDDVPF